jgi:hypothetical protein
MKLALLLCEFTPQTALLVFVAGPAFATKETIQCHWEHELPECCCVAVDAEVHSPGIVTRASLYRVETAAAEEKAPVRASFFRMSQISAKDDTPNASGFAYMLDTYRTGDREPVSRTLLDIPLPNLAGDGVTLTCMKLVGGCVVIGGTGGYIGIAHFGAAGSAPSDSLRTEDRQFHGHSAAATVTCIASCRLRQIAIAGDNLGGLSMWSPQQGVSNLLQVIHGFATGGHAINNIQFVPERDYIVVSTQRKQILINLVFNPSGGSYKMEKIAAIDFDSIFLSRTVPVTGSVKSLSASDGDDSSSSIFLCCMAFPSSLSAVTLTSTRFDIGHLKSRAHTPQTPQTPTALGSPVPAESKPVIVWRLSGASASSGQYVSSH